MSKKAKNMEVLSCARCGNLPDVQPDCVACDYCIDVPLFGSIEEWNKFQIQANGACEKCKYRDDDPADNPVCQDCAEQRLSQCAAHETGQGFWQAGDIAGTLRAEARTAPADRRTSNIIYTMDADRSNSMKSANPNSGIHEADVAKTLDCTVSSPQKAQGGQMVVSYSIGNGQTAEAAAMQKEVCQTLHCMHDHSAVICYENHAQDSRVTELKGACSQLNAKAGTGGNNLPLVQTFTKTAHPQNHEQGQGFAETDVAKTLSVHTSPASEIRAEELVAVAIAENIIGRKPKNGGNGIGVSEEVAYTQDVSGMMGAANFATVRRLLPVECERLMGFPDNWTRIRWKGKSEEDCPDSPRYKACGNSMCVNVMRWIGMRIEIAERKSNA